MFYTLDEEGRIIISTQSFTVKWRNAVRQPKVSLMVPDGQSQIVIYGTAEAIDADPTGSSSAPTCKHSSHGAMRSDHRAVRRELTT